MNSDTQIILYQGEDGGTHIEVRFTGEAVWLSQQQMAELYQTTRPNIVQHIRNIYADGELDDAYSGDNHPGIPAITTQFFKHGRSLCA